MNVDKVYPTDCVLLVYTKIGCVEALAGLVLLSMTAVAMWTAPAAEWTVPAATSHMCWNLELALMSNSE